MLIRRRSAAGGPAVLRTRVGNSAQWLRSANSETATCPGAMAPLNSSLPQLGIYQQHRTTFMNKLATGISVDEVAHVRLYAELHHAARAYRKDIRWLEIAIKCRPQAGFFNSATGRILETPRLKHQPPVSGGISRTGSSFSERACGQAFNNLYLTPGCGEKDPCEHGQELRCSGKVSWNTNTADLAAVVTYP